MRPPWQVDERRNDDTGWKLLFSAILGAGFLNGIIDDELKYARFYDGEKIHGHGEYLMGATKNRQNSGEYVSYCSRLIFDADSPLTRTPGEKLIDDEATAMLEAGRNDA